jgi:hypothetical protein
MSKKRKNATPSPTLLLHRENGRNRAAEGEVKKGEPRTVGRESKPVNVHGLAPSRGWGLRATENQGRGLGRGLPTKQPPVSRLLLLAQAGRCSRAHLWPVRTSKSGGGGHPQCTKYSVQRSRAWLLAKSQRGGNRTWMLSSPTSSLRILAAWPRAGVPPRPAYGD